MVASLAVQLSVLFSAECMLVGFAVKDAIEGTEPVPESESGAFVTPAQLVRPTQAKRMRTTALRLDPERLYSSELRLLLQRELAESKHDRAAVMVHTIVLSAHFRLILVARTELGQDWVRYTDSNQCTFPDAGVVGEAETFWRSSGNRPGHPNYIRPSFNDCLQFRRCRKATKRFSARFFSKNPRISPRYFLV